MIGKAIFNKSPFTPNKLAELPLGAIKPSGWLLDQLETQAKGLSGTLGKYWPYVNEDSAWAGGSGDAWERAPYYLDGLVPLAWELDDEELKSKCKKYLNWIFSSQREDGWFGPRENKDYWPNMIVLKAVMQYFTATGDKKALVFMDNYFRYENKNIEDIPLSDWAVARAQENMLAVEWLYNITGQKYLLDLLYKLKDQSLDWTNQLHAFPYIRAMSRSFTWERLKTGKESEEAPITGTMRPYFSTQYHLTHGVNIAMSLKAPGVISLFKSGYKEQNAFHVGWQRLMKYHGVANGIFTCDEHINGDSPIQGTELCAVVETMFSLETLIGAGSFDPNIPDMLEKLAFNALPAAFTADMRSHQYVQQVNQVKVSIEHRNWYNNDDDSNIYGLEPNFGCCTANMHQGWPKFVSHLWYATDDGGLAAVSYAPCSIRFSSNGVPVQIKVVTDYPFEQKVRIQVKLRQACEFPLYLKIPGWSENTMITLPDGEILSVAAGKTASLSRRWSDGDTIELDFNTVPRVTNWGQKSLAVEYGPLLMAYRPKENWSKLNDYGYSEDWQVTTDSTWNYAVLPDRQMQVVHNDAAPKAFGKGDSAVQIKVKAVIVPEWKMEGGSTAPIPIGIKADPAAETDITLVPYGDTGLRIAQFPSVTLTPSLTAD